MSIAIQIHAATNISAQSKQNHHVEYIVRTIRFKFVSERFLTTHEVGLVQKLRPSKTRETLVTFSIKPYKFKGYPIWPMLNLYAPPIWVQWVQFYQHNLVGYLSDLPCSRENMGNQVRHRDIQLKKSPIPPDIRCDFSCNSSDNLEWPRAVSLSSVWYLPGPPGDGQKPDDSWGKSKIASNTLISLLDTLMQYCKTWGFRVHFGDEYNEQYHTSAVDRMNTSRRSLTQSLAFTMTHEGYD